jgi:hypothetical protein
MGTEEADQVRLAGLASVVREALVHDGDRACAPGLHVIEQSYRRPKLTQKSTG